MSKVWFITGSGSGIGAGTVKAALDVMLNNAGYSLIGNFVVGV